MKQVLALWCIRPQNGQTDFKKILLKIFKVCLTILERYVLKG